MMELVDNWEAISIAQQKVKKEGKSLFTNFFVDPEKGARWVSNQSLFIQTTHQGILIFRKSYFFYHLYYYTSTLGYLQSLLENHLPNEQLVTDIIASKQNQAILLPIFNKTGFNVHRQLIRYSRINKEDSNYYNSSEDVKVAEEEDAEIIADLFAQNFDKLSEQVPDLEEVKDLIGQRKILIIKEQGIKGLLVRTINGQSTILNNLLVDKKFRGEKVGAELLNHYIFESRHLKRMVLWVVSDNEIAINAYEKRGYAKDDLVDNILKYSNGQDN